MADVVSSGVHRRSGGVDMADRLRHVCVGTGQQMYVMSTVGGRL